MHQFKLRRKKLKKSFLQNSHLFKDLKTNLEYQTNKLKKNCKKKNLKQQNENESIHES